MTDTRLHDWHRFLRGEIDVRDVLDPNCRFLSPVVYTPQEGRELTAAYLEAAKMVFTAGQDDFELGEDGNASGFRYAKEVVDGDHAILEFEADFNGTYVNGVDMLTFGDDGKVVEFKVMVRPLQALNLLHQLMGAELDDAPSRPTASQGAAGS